MVKEVKKMQLLIKGEESDLVINTDWVIDVRRNGSSVFFCYRRSDCYSVMCIDFESASKFGIEFDPVSRAKGFIESYVNFVARGEGRMIVSDVAFHEVNNEIEEYELPF